MTITVSAGCILSRVQFSVEVYRYQIFPFSDIGYSLFNKKPILIANLIYNKLFSPCIAHII